MVQLLRVNDPNDNAVNMETMGRGTTWIYRYDLGGNIQSKTAYPYTTGTPGTALYTVPFLYDDPNWKDKLTAVNGIPISYDEIGNPLNDGTWNYVWEHGRQLKSMTRGTEDTAGYRKLEFQHNKDGLRVQKKVTEYNAITGQNTVTTTDYILHGKNIQHMTVTADGTEICSMHFYYDAQNRPSIVEIAQNGTIAAFAYLYNLQGDAIGLVDASGNTVVKYRYDAWGKLLSITGSLADSLGKHNPFRYRGYVYDEETGLYYLRSRYYNPDWCRFINADAFIKGNMFSYSNNSPIVNADADGNKSYSTIGPHVDLFQLVYDQPEILGDVAGLLQEQKRIINKRIKYTWGGQTDSSGYSCATFVSKSLQESSFDSNDYIHCETGTTSMLKDGKHLMLFIASLDDYSLDEIPVGATFLREKGYNGHKHGHAATFAERISGTELSINQAAGISRGILQEQLSFDELKMHFQYVAWHVGLGTQEKWADMFAVLEDEP